MNVRTSRDQIVIGKSVIVGIILVNENSKSLRN